MKAFICVYRQPQVSRTIWNKVQAAAAGNSLLQDFLTVYGRPDCFFDWGDDPGFFAATRLMGNVNFASWGVCRGNVRRQLQPGDLVIYFCGRQSKSVKESWEYFYIGYGAVKQSVERRTIWEDDNLAPFRGFFNCLVKYKNGVRSHYEPFGEPHDDWEKRIQAGYILFDPVETHFNLVDPILVAVYHDKRQPCETWMLQDPLVRRLHSALFFDGLVTRGLRIPNPYRPHGHIALHHYIKNNVDDRLLALKAELAAIASAGQP
jgi:hypothetical protein